MVQHVMEKPGSGEKGTEHLLGTPDLPLWYQSRRSRDKTSGEPEKKE
jgi:hypothetical protein